MRSIELFVGTGGLALGTARAGFEHEVVIECNPHAVATLRSNKKRGVEHVSGWNIYDGRIEDFDYSTLKTGIDLVSAGPPCQPFSLGGKHRGHKDERNLFPRVVEAVRLLRPKAFMVENVKGLLRRSFRPYYEYIVTQLARPVVTPMPGEGWRSHAARLRAINVLDGHDADRYRVQFKLLNAANYGVPQCRERVIIIGVRSDIKALFAYPDTTHSEDELLWQKWVTGDYWRVVGVKPPTPTQGDNKRVLVLLAKARSGSFKPGQRQPWVTVRQAIMGLPVLRAGQTDPKDSNHYLNPGARPYAGHTGSPLDEPAKTLKAGDHGVPGGENTLRLDGRRVRYFSVREAARLQTFPDDWRFEGAWTEGMRQLGNAVPVLLAETVAKRLAEVISPAEAGGPRAGSPRSAS